MWIFTGKYSGEAKAYIKRKEKREMTIAAWISLIIIVVIYLIMAIAWGIENITNVIIALCGGVVTIALVYLILFLYYKREPKCEIKIANDGFSVYDGNGSWSFVFYKIESVEYYDNFIVIKPAMNRKVVLQKELLVEGSWEGLQELLKKVEDSLDSDEPMYQIEETATEFFEAKIKAKRIYKKFTTGVSMATPVSIFQYFATFELENGEEIEYGISEECYEGIEEGQTGTLVIVNGNFFSFGEGEDV